jgi:hypothetical protein
MGVTAFSGLDEKSIKYLHRKIGKVDPKREREKHFKLYVYK